MFKKKNTIVLSSLLFCMASVSINAANLTASGTAPYLYFDDSNSATAHTWRVAGQRTISDTYFYIENMENSRKILRIYDTSGEGENAFMSDTNGDIGLANGSVFIDKSANYLGIGTSTPEAEIHVKPGGDFIIFGSTAASVKLDATASSDWSLTASKFTSFFTGLTTNSFYLRDNNASTIPFVVNSGAPSYSLAVSGTGNVGLGTSAPEEKLDVLAKENGARLVLSTIAAGTYDSPQFTSRKAGSDGSGNIENTKNLDVMGTFAWRGHDGTDWTGAKALLWVRADGDWSGTSTGTTVEIRQTPKNSTTALIAMQIKNHADVYFPNGNLYVKGTKVTVPDYVFKEDYKLMPLKELKAYVAKNNHLPGVVSAEEVGKEGVVNLSGLQMTLLEKVEELTLYTLQEEALATKTQQMKLMEEKISNLEAMQKRLAKVESLLTNLALDTSNTKSEKVSVNLK